MRADCIPFFERQAAWMGRWPFRGLSVIDYGAQHGQHSRAALKYGATSALAIECRPENIDAARAEYGETPGLRWLCADVRNLGEIGEFDVMLCFGLLYHLDYPMRFLRQELSRVRSGLLMWTHYTTDGRDELDGYRGAFWSDAGTGMHDSIAPLRAFWFTLPELTRCLEDNGFVIDAVQEMPTPANAHYNAAILHATRRLA